MEARGKKTEAYVGVANQSQVRPISELINYSGIKWW